MNIIIVVGVMLLYMFLLIQKEVDLNSNYPNIQPKYIIKLYTYVYNQYMSLKAW